MNSSDLSAACRFLDQEVAKSGFTGAMKALDINEDEIKYVAAQRALRIILLGMRGLKELPNTMVPYELTEEELKIEKLLCIAAFDGISIGIAAGQGLAKPEDPPHHQN
jgi:hypothetical protein